LKHKGIDDILRLKANKVFMKHSNDLNLLIIADRYWPVIGGIEKTIGALSTSLPGRFKLSILTHRAPQESKTLFESYWSCVPYPLKDFNDNTIIPLKSPFFKKTFLLPLLLWNIPGIRHFFPAASLFDLLFLFYRMAFYRTVKNIICHANIVHCFSTGWLARLTTEICLKESIPLVHSPAVHFGKWGDSTAQLKAYTSAHALICFSNDVKSKLLEHYPVKDHSKIHIIPPLQHGISIKDPSKRIIDEPYILFLGRREKHKGLHLLIEAYRTINFQIKLVIAGPGEKITETDSSIIDLGVVSDEDKAILLTHCELFVLPSSDESFGIVYTESMSCGIPVVALDVPPVNEIVKNGVTGILVPPDSTEALAAAMTRILTDHRLGASMGKCGHDIFIERYSPEVVASQIVEVYNNAIATIDNNLLFVHGRPRRFGVGQQD
jgi:glycosyltransferase involved in cell wall biosynthesis